MLSVRTERFTIDRPSYLRAMWLSGLGWAPFARIGLVVIGAALYGLVRGSATGFFVSGTGLVALVIGTAVRYARARRDVYRRSSAMLFDDPRTMDISDRGVSTRTEGGIETTVPWTSINRAAWRGGFTLLYFSRIGHLVVPDAAFHSEGDRQAFRTLLGAQGFPVADCRKS